MAGLLQKAIELHPFAAGDERACEHILRRLPDWFGIEESLVEYVRDTQRYPTWLAYWENAPAGFVTVHRHFPESAEIHCIAVLPERHGMGIGRMMIEFVESELRRAGVLLLQVKTLGPSRRCEHYERTRGFYRALGFVPVEEFQRLWGGIPCLLMVKRV